MFYVSYEVIIFGNVLALGKRFRYELLVRKMNVNVNRINAATENSETSALNVCMINGDDYYGLLIV